MPLHKILGTENLADLNTKHVPARTMMKYLEKMDLHLTDGRAQAAAQLHSLGDSWTRRGLGGVWERRHTTPRKALFTPDKAAKGPKTGGLKAGRVTTGVYSNGERFELRDVWSDGTKLLGSFWTGTTLFYSKGVGDGTREELAV